MAVERPRTIDVQQFSVYRRDGDERAARIDVEEPEFVRLLVLRIGRPPSDVELAALVAAQIENRVDARRPAGGPRSAGRRDGHREVAAADRRIVIATSGDDVELGPRDGFVQRRDDRDDRGIVGSGRQRNEERAGENAERPDVARWTRWHAEGRAAVGPDKGKGPVGRKSAQGGASQGRGKTWAHGDDSFESGANVASRGSAGSSSERRPSWRLPGPTLTSS